MTVTNPNPHHPGDADYTETVKLHHEHGNDVTAIAVATCTEFGNNRVSLRITDPATDKSTWVWMSAADALMLGGALQATGGVAAPTAPDVDEPGRI